MICKTLNVMNVKARRDIKKYFGKHCYVQGKRVLLYLSHSNHSYVKTEAAASWSFVKFKMYLMNKIINETLNVFVTD